MSCACRALPLRLFIQNIAPESFTAEAGCSQGAWRRSQTAHLNSGLQQRGLHTRTSKLQESASEFDKPTSRRISTRPSPSDEPLEPWAVQKAALREKFPEGWQPLKRLSPDALNGIRALNKQHPTEFTTEVLANKFEVSPEAIRRILKSKWRPNEEEEVDRSARWQRRGESVWQRWAEQGIKPPKRWREAGVERSSREGDRSGEISDEVSAMELEGYEDDFEGLGEVDADETATVSRFAAPKAQQSEQPRQGTPVREDARSSNSFQWPDIGTVPRSLSAHKKEDRRPGFKRAFRSVRSHDRGAAARLADLPRAERRDATQAEANDTSRLRGLERRGSERSDAPLWDSKSSGQSQEARMQPIETSGRDSQFDRAASAAQSSRTIAERTRRQESPKSLMQILQEQRQTEKPAKGAPKQRMRNSGRLKRGGGGGRGMASASF